VDHLSLNQLTYGGTPGLDPDAESRRNDNGVLRRSEDLSAAAPGPACSALCIDTDPPASFITPSWTDVPYARRNLSRSASRVRLSSGFGRFNHSLAGVRRNFSSVPRLEAGTAARVDFQYLRHARFNFCDRARDDLPGASVHGTGLLDSGLLGSGFARHSLHNICRPDETLAGRLSITQQQQSDGRENYAKN